MEKGSKIEASNGEIDLPQPLIQHIQSFLSGKEAAQTTLLSKSWYTAWLTRPNLDLDQRYFLKAYSYRPNIEAPYERFTRFANNTFRRYHDFNLKIESFKLCIYDWNSSASVGSELILEAIKLGATDVEFIDYFATGSLLPHELFGYENLVSLTAEGYCLIDGLGIDGQIKCSKLKSLSLRRVKIEGDVIWDIMASCPLIEKLSLFECTCVVEVKAFDVFTREMTRSLPPRPFMGLEKQNEFHKLKCLILNTVSLDTSFFWDFSSKFPCLKDLSVLFCAGYKEVKLCSRSLECVNLGQDKVFKAKFDLPRLCKFSFSSLVLPILSFENILRQWESDISIRCLQTPGTSFFIRLRKLMAKLSMSKISLSIGFCSLSEKDYDYPRNVKGLPKPTVENLKVWIWKEARVSCAHLDALIWSCRPKFLTPNWLATPLYNNMASADLRDPLCKTLVQEVSENCFIPNRNMRGLHDLKEVNAEILEESVSEWRPLPWTTLLNAWGSLANRREIRFEMKWE